MVKHKHVWDSPSFRHAVLGNSLATASGKRGPTAPPDHVPADAVALVTRQLKLASAWKALPSALCKAFTRAHHSFQRSEDLLEPAVGAQADSSKAFEYLTTVVARLRSLGPGEALVLSRPSPLPGEKDGSGRVLYLVHRNAAAPIGSDFTVAVCTSSSAALGHHPARVDPATGALQHAAPLLLRDVPLAKVCDGAFWYLALIVEQKGWTANLLYERLLPALNNKPLLANWSNGSLAADAPQAGLRTSAVSHWKADAVSGPGRPIDPHGHESTPMPDAA